MVAGDVVTDSFNLGVGVSQDFQPAAGVEVVLTIFGIAPQDADGQIVAFDGTVTVIMFDGSFGRITVVKWFINNTNRIRFTSQVGSHGFLYSGIQTA